MAETSRQVQASGQVGGPGRQEHQQHRAVHGARQRPEAAQHDGGQQLQREGQAEGAGGGQTGREGQQTPAEPGAGRAHHEGADLQTGDVQAGQVRAAADVLLGEIELRSGTAAEARRALAVVSEGLAGPRQQQAVVALLRASEVAMITGSVRQYLALARRVAAVPRPPGVAEDPVTRLMHAQFTGFAESLTGHHRRARAGLRETVALAPAVEDGSGLVVATLAALQLGDEGAAAGLAERALARSRGRSSVDESVALEFLAYAEFLGDRYEAAGEHAREGLRLAERSGLHNCAAAQLGILALLAAAKGPDHEALDRARAAARRADGRGVGRPHALASWAAVRTALAAGHPETALAEVRAATDRPTPGGMHPIVRVIAAPDVVEAAVAIGDGDRARELFGVFRAWAEGMESRSMRALAARCEALLGEDDDADERFRTAIELQGSCGLAFERSRTRLLYGRLLRRTRRPARAREHLLEALTTFEALGADGWATLARAEVRAAGGAVAGARLPASLTPQQGEIARLVAGGATNREIATLLFLSPRTVDHHLRNIFVRLGIRSRVDLTRLLT